MTSVYAQFTHLRSFADFTAEQRVAVHAAALEGLDAYIEHLDSGRPYFEYNDSRRSRRQVEVPGIPFFGEINTFSHKDRGWVCRLDIWSHHRNIGNPDSGAVGAFSMSSVLWSVTLLEEIDCYDFDEPGHWAKKARAAIAAGQYSPARTERETDLAYEALVAERIAYRKEQSRLERLAAEAAAVDQTRAQCPHCKSEGVRDDQHRGHGKWDYLCGGFWSDRSELPEGVGAGEQKPGSYYTERGNPACLEIHRLRAELERAAAPTNA